MIRLQKLLAEAGLGSRRTSEERIRAGRGRWASTGGGSTGGGRAGRATPLLQVLQARRRPPAAPGGTAARSRPRSAPPGRRFPDGGPPRRPPTPPEATRHLANSGPGRIDTPVPRNQNTRLVLRRGTQAANGSRL